MARKPRHFIRTAHGAGKGRPQFEVPTADEMPAPVPAPPAGGDDAAGEPARDGCRVGSAAGRRAAEHRDPQRNARGPRIALRSLDAIHLATALSIRDDIGAFFTYDRRLAESAVDYGLPVASPS